MPTFTAIALERFLEPVDSRSDSDSKLDRSKSTPVMANGAAGNDSRPVSVPHRKPSILLPPPAHNNALKRNSSSRTTAEKEKAPRPQISPALYATPEATPLPDSPTPHSPSPYLINHKRRGPRLQKSFSEASVLKKKTLDENMPSSSNLSAKVETKSSVAAQDIVVAAQSSSAEENTTNGLHQKKSENGVMFDLNGESKALPGTNSVEKESESEDFFDPQESLSVASNTDGEDFGVELSSRTITPGGVFYDAWDELSSEGGRQMLSSMHDLETELREMKLSLLMEVEKRKQAEDALTGLRSQWRRLREELREVGLVLPLDLPTIAQDGSNVDFTEEVHQQMYVSRVVSESIGRGAARAEYEEEMEAQLESKNFEIARLSDRLRYYETMNREMSQRNQEAIELARRDRQRRSGMQKWAWGSIAAAVTLGSVALAWSYLPSGNPSSSHQLHASEPDTSTE